LKEQTLPVDSAAAPAARAPRARRRVAAFPLGLGGAVVAILYGVGVMHMRMGAPLVVLGLGGMTLVLAAVALWRVLDPLSRANLTLEAAPRAAGRLRELEREKQLVLKAIKEVELDYQMRKVAEADYKDMVERYRARALRLISELEAGDNFRPLIERELRDRLAAAEAAPAESATAAPAAAEIGACPACGTRNDDDAQFCKKCGGKLGSIDRGDRPAP
jgi:hypothetical protein